MIHKEYNHKYILLRNENDVPSQETVWCFWRRRRLLVTFLAFFGFFNIYALRVNLSIAVVAMTEPRQRMLANGTLTSFPEFDWDPKTKGLILSSFFYGYILTQVPAGWLATKIGGNRLFGIGVGATSILTVMTPPLAYSGTTHLVILRVVEGFFEGVTFPSMHAVWAAWAPGPERSRLAAVAYAGSYAGTVLAMPAGSALADTAGWPAIFYVFGLVGFIWTVVWWLIVEESPEKDSSITPDELKYIQESREVDLEKRGGHPWKSMVRSGPVWAIVTAHFCENWGFYTMLTMLPTFMKDIYHLNTKETGLASGIPYGTLLITVPLAAVLGDWLVQNGILSRTRTRQLFTSGPFLAQCLFLILMTYSRSPVACVALLSISVGLGGCVWTGFGVNHLDIAPRQASILMGLSNTAGTLPGMIAPALAGAIVPNKTADEWRVVFFISSGLYLMGAVLYAALGSAELQPWAGGAHSGGRGGRRSDERSGKRGYENKAVHLDNDNILPATMS